MLCRFWQSNLLFKHLNYFKSFFPFRLLLSELFWVVRLRYLLDFMLLQYKARGLNENMFSAATEGGVAPNLVENLASENEAINLIQVTLE